jgi:hypothetical protein
MLLGADDFVQDQAHHRARIHGLAREALGYGTLSGLALSTRAGDRGPEVSVSPGVGLTRAANSCAFAKPVREPQRWLARDDIRTALLEQLGDDSPVGGQSGPSLFVPRRMPDRSRARSRRALSLRGGRHGPLRITMTTTRTPTGAAPSRPRSGLARLCPWLGSIPIDEAVPERRSPDFLQPSGTPSLPLPPRQPRPSSLWISFSAARRPASPFRR